MADDMMGASPAEIAEAKAARKAARPIAPKRLKPPAPPEPLHTGRVAAPSDDINDYCKGGKVISSRSY